MKTKLLSYLFFIIAAIAYGQDNNNAIISTEKGPLVIYPILHSTMVIEWNGMTIYSDPYGGAAAFEGMKKADLILITDIHGDHLNLATLEALNANETAIVTCQAVADQLPATFTNVKVMANGAKLEWQEIGLEAIPMYNLPEDETSRHTKGRGNGYVLTMGGKRIYISGDTEDIPEMRALTNIDAAFVCMNLPYTMDIEAAASAVLEFKPKAVYPFHYRGGGGVFSDVKQFKALVQKANPAIDVVLLEWYPSNK